MKRTLNRLDSIHRSLSVAVQKIDPILFSRRPAENEWSIAEVLDHLCLVEERVLSELQKSVDGPPARVSFLRQLVPTRIVSWRLIRVKAPKAVRPNRSLPKEESLKTYDELRARLKEFCLEHGRQRLKQIGFRHPFLGDLDGVAAISMVAFHERRHHKQIREILKKLGAG